MIERETLIRWAHELVAFANGSEADSLFTERDVDAADAAAHRLPDEPRTPAQAAALRKRARDSLAALARWQPSKLRGVPQRLLREAERWLDDPLVRTTHAAHNLTPMDGRLSLDEQGRLQVAPRFRSPDAQFAVTFAEMIQERTPVFVKRCATCTAFYIYRRGSRGQPPKLCPTHSAQSERTKKRTDQ